MDACCAACPGLVLWAGPDCRELQHCSRKVYRLACIVSRAASSVLAQSVWLDLYGLLLQGSAVLRPAIVLHVVIFLFYFSCLQLNNGLLFLVRDETTRCMRRLCEGSQAGCI